MIIDVVHHLPPCEGKGQRSMRQSEYLFQAYQECFRSLEKPLY